MVINTQLNLYDYLAVVDDIVSVYFHDGEYRPHFGIINVIRLFYNFCVTESKFDEDIPHDIVDADDLIPLLSDEEFMKEFNSVIAEPESFQFDFSNAYKNAMEIVDTKRNSFDNLVDKIKIMCDEIVDKIASVMSDSNIDKLSSIVDGFQNIDINADSILDAYAHSQAFEDAISGKRNDENIDENVIKFKKE